MPELFPPTISIASVNKVRASLGVDLLSFCGGELLSHFFWEVDQAGKSAELEQ